MIFVPSLPRGLLDAVVTDANVQPAVNSHANAVRRMIAAAVGNLVGREARDEHFLPIGDAVGIVVMKDARASAGA